MREAIQLVVGLALTLATGPAFADESVPYNDRCASAEAKDLTCDDASPSTTSNESLRYERGSSRDEVSGTTARTQVTEQGQPMDAGTGTESPADAVKNWNQQRFLQQTWSSSP